MGVDAGGVAGASVVVDEIANAIVVAVVVVGESGNTCGVGTADESVDENAGTLTGDSMQPAVDLEKLRLTYNLTRESLVVDIGAHTGRFTREISTAYSCRVLAFEPIPAFYEGLKPLVNERVRVVPLGVGGFDAVGVSMSVRGDSSGLYTDSPEKVSVNVISANTLFQQYLKHAPLVDLMKINIEGAEYDLLDGLLDGGWMRKICYLQVQFHVYGAGPVGPEARRDAIRDRLAETHTVMWDFPFIWESHELKPELRS